MQILQIDDGALEYTRIGHGEPVVCVHGAFVADTFRPLGSVPGLADRFALVLYHRRGYAGSGPAPAGLSIERQAADCKALMDRLEIGPAHVVGHSYGGAIALQLALDHPDAVRTLALLEPALMVGESGRAYRASLEDGIAAYEAEGATTVVDRFLEARWPGYRPRLEEALPGAFDRAVLDAATSFAVELPALMEWTLTEGQAGTIRHPTLSVLGGDSLNLVARFGEVHRWLQATLPNAEGVVVDGATHFMLVEDPVGTGAGLAEFWHRHGLGADHA